MNTKLSIVLCIVAFFLAVPVTSFSTNDLNLDLDLTLNYTMQDLNASAPHLVTLMDKLEAYSLQYLNRDLMTFKPHAEFLMNFWLPAEVKTFLNSVESFMDNNLSLEFNAIRKSLLHYVNSYNAQEDFIISLRRVERFINMEVPTHLQRRVPFLKYYYDTFASAELKSLVDDAVAYVDLHFEHELRALEADLTQKINNTTQRRYYQSRSVPDTTQSE